MKISSTATFLSGLVLFLFSIFYGSELTNSASELWEFLSISWISVNILFWFAIYFTGSTFTDHLTKTTNKTWKNSNDHKTPLAGCTFMLLFYRHMLVILTNPQLTKNQRAQGHFTHSLSRSIIATVYCSGWIVAVYLVLLGLEALQNSRQAI